MSTTPLTKSEAEEIAKALVSLGIKKLSGGGVDRTLSDALNKQKNPGVTTGNTDELKDIKDFFEHIDEIDKKLEAIRTQATGARYGRLSAAMDLYSYVNLALEAEGEADTEIKTSASGFDARSAAATEIVSWLGVLSKSHVSSVGIIAALRDLDSNAKSYIFKDETLRDYYDKYLVLKQGGLIDKLILFKKLPERLLTSVQISERLIDALQSGMSITRAEAVWLYNRLLGFSQVSKYIDMENENGVLTCAGCGAVNRMSSKQLAALYGKRQFPICAACSKPLLRKCPTCNKYMPAAATKHVCGWNMALSKHKMSLENAIARKDLTAIRIHLDVIEQMSAKEEDIQDLRSKAHALISDLQARVVDIQKMISGGEVKNAKHKLTEAEKVYPNNSDLLKLRIELARQEKNVLKAALLEKIREGLTNNDLNAVSAAMKDAETMGVEASDLDVYRKEYFQRARINLVSLYSAKIEALLTANQFEEADKIMADAENHDIGDELFNYRKIIDDRKEEQRQLEKQAILEFGGGHFGNYSNGLKKVARILDIYPASRQARMWLKDNPRTMPISKPTLLFKQGENQCTISWEDDDSCTRYTVCRAEGRYPRDPDDGIKVCSDITNSKVTDSLPLDMPGVMWMYSIFGIRTLDGQWVKTDCPNEAVWLPNPDEVKIENGKDEKGRPVVVITWPSLRNNCAGVHILRYDSDDNYRLPVKKLTIDPKDPDDLEAQLKCCFTDDDIESDVTYRYVIKQVWKKGQSQQLMSTGITKEIAVH